MRRTGEGSGLLPRRSEGRVCKTAEAALGTSVRGPGRAPRAWVSAAPESSRPGAGALTCLELKQLCPVSGGDRLVAVGRTGPADVSQPTRRCS